MQSSLPAVENLLPAFQTYKINMLFPKDREPWCVKLEFPDFEMDIFCFEEFSSADAAKLSESVEKQTRETPSDKWICETLMAKTNSYQVDLKIRKSFSLN